MAGKGQKLLAAGTTLVVAEPALALAHQGGIGVIVGLALGVAAYHAVGDIEQLASKGTQTPSLASTQTSASRSDFVHRLFSGKSVREQEIVTEALPVLDKVEPLQPKRTQYNFSGDDELSAPMRRPQGVMLFSDTLKSFAPSLDKIYIGTLATGKMVFCKAEDLCHVALAGSTRGGKSSIMRMLLAQLCYTGTSVLVLNPHYSKYILDKKEDWTPFEPYLMHDPMECRKYDVIEHYLKQIATVLLPKRLDRFAVGQPVGKPYFLALDELPDIVKHIPDASSYLDDILRQGAKVGIFLICASQDFLVKTLRLEGGAVRECYRSAFYVGGDATTAKSLLDMPANQIDESILGTGTIMLRNWQACKRSVLAYVPLVDNQVLYTLLGPSTYQRTNQHVGDDRLEDMQPMNAPELRTATQTATQEQTTRRRVAANGYEANRQRKAQESAIRREWHASAPKQVPTKQDNQQPCEQAQSPEDSLKADERQVLHAYREGYRTGNAIAGMTELPGTRVNQCLNKLSALGMIDWQPKVKN